MKTDEKAKRPSAGATDSGLTAAEFLDYLDVITRGKIEDQHVCMHDEQAEDEVRELADIMLAAAEEAKEARNKMLTSDISDFDEMPALSRMASIFLIKITNDEAGQKSSKRALDTLHAQNRSNKEKACAEWDRTGHTYSGIAGFARQHHERYEVTERVLGRWISSHRKSIK